MLGDDLFFGEKLSLEHLLEQKMFFGFFYIFLFIFFC